MAASSASELQTRSRQPVAACSRWAASMSSRETRGWPAVTSSRRPGTPAAQRPGAAGQRRRGEAGPRGGGAATGRSRATRLPSHRRRARARWLLERGCGSVASYGEDAGYGVGRWLCLNPRLQRHPNPAMVDLDPDGSEGAPDVFDLFCHYNSLYFRDSLGSCAVSWAEDPLPDRDVSTCDYYPEGGGCIILLSKSLCECHDESDLKNALLHEMIHAYICIKDNNSNHSDHGPKFQKLMNTINFSSVADPHRPVDGYSITLLHDIHKKYYHYKCQTCGDLIKSTKMRGPSDDNCIEKKGVDDPCQNSKCHWHRHKQQCVGSYRRVQELSPGGLEPKRSKAAEVLNEDKTEEPVFSSWHSTHTSNKSRRSNINEKEDGSSESHLVTDDAVGCSKMDSSRDGSNKKIKLLKDVSSDLQRAETVQEAPKRPRMAALENQDRSRGKKRKHSKRDGSYSVIIEWLNYYCLSESDEDEVPLINKRTERRRRQKLHEMSLGRDPSNCVEFGGSTSPTSGSCPLDPGDNSKLQIVPASLHEERSCPNNPASSNGVAGNQTGHESMPSPLNSPVRGEIVDISDG